LSCDDAEVPANIKVADKIGKQLTFVKKLSAVGISDADAVG